MYKNSDSLKGQYENVKTNGDAVADRLDHLRRHFSWFNAIVAEIWL